MKHNRLEQQIAGLFENHQPEVDTDQLWSDIEPLLDKKEKKRRFFFFWFFLGVGLFLGGIYIVQPNATQSGPQELGQYNAPQIIRTKERLQPTQMQTLLAANLPTQKKEAARSNPPQKVVQIAVPPIMTQKNTAAKIVDIENQSELLTGTTPPTQVESLVPIFDSPLAYLPGNTFLQTKKITLDTELEFPDVTSENIKLETKTSNKRWKNHLDLFLSPEQALRQLKSKSYDTNLEDLRKSSERRLESYSLGLSYKLQHKNGFTLVTGLEYREINEKFEWFEFKRETETIDGILTVVENRNGDIIETNRGAKEIIRITNRGKETYNHYRTINVPIGLGYHIAGNKFGMEILGGLDMNIAFLKKGDAFSSTDTPRRFNSTNNYGGQMFDRKAGWGLWTSVSFVHSFSPKWAWFAAPYIRLQLNSVTTKDYTLEQRHHNIGVRLGCRYSLDQTIPKNK